MSDDPFRRGIKLGSEFVTTMVLGAAVFAVLLALIANGTIPTPSLPHFF